VLLGLVILCCDGVLAHVRGVLLIGVFDELAHLATASIILVAVRRRQWLRQHSRETVVVLASAVLIDLDHVPLYAGVPGISLGGRPYSHSLLTVAVLLLIAVGMPAFRRRWPLAMAAGVCLHLLRDVSTGPGVLLAWPVRDEEVLAPYHVYAAVCASAVVVATLRLARPIGST